MQDNKSAILLKKKYPFSIGKGSKHINVRYFFVVDKVKNNEVKKVYCPTAEMVADYNSKPVQGALFIKLRNLIQGIRIEDYGIYKKNYTAILKQYELYDDHEKDLENI